MTKTELEKVINSDHFDRLKVGLLSPDQIRVLLDQIAKHPDCPTVKMLVSLCNGQVEGVGTTFPVEVGVVDYDIDPKCDKPEDFDLPVYDDDNGHWIGIIRDYGMHPDHNDEDAQKYWDMIDGK
jgi:hypothetical protein